MSADDVHQVAFGRSSFGGRGYDWEVVDAYLNDLERELGRRSESENR